MANGKIRVGLIGANVHYGWSMRAHLPAILALPEYELTAVCTRHKETAEESAQHFGARFAFHDHEEMVTHPDIDMVSVSVRVPSHHQLVMAALNAGKHVYCEWPLGANLAEAQEMADLARSKGVQTMVGLQARGDPALLRLQELIAEGYVGQVLACNMTMFLPGILLPRAADRIWMAERELGGHALLISTGHAIDVLCFCVGEFKEVSGQVATQVKEWNTTEPGNRVDVTAPDNILVSGVLTNGVVASVHIGTIPWHGSGWKIEVYGREGTLVASSREMVQYANIHLWGGVGVRRSQDVGGEPKELPVPDRLTWVPGGVPKGEPFNVAQLYRRFSEAIQEGKPASPDFDLALNRHRLLDAIERSSDQGVRQQVS